MSTYLADMGRNAVFEAIDQKRPIAPIVAALSGNSASNAMHMLLGALHAVQVTLRGLLDAGVSVRSENPEFQALVEAAPHEYALRWELLRTAAPRAAEPVLQCAAETIWQMRDSLTVPPTCFEPTPQPEATKAEPPLVVNVNVPEQAAPVVQNTVNVPQTPAPAVQNVVNVPAVQEMKITAMPERGTKTEIVRDSMGNIIKSVQTEGDI